MDKKHIFSNDNEKLIDLINGNRETNSKFHLHLAREWKVYGQIKYLHNPLAYSAFEYRMAIERLLFEFYLLAVGKDIFSDKHAKEAYSLDRLIKSICRIVGFKDTFVNRLKFNRIFAEYQKSDNQYPKGLNLPSVFDISILNKYWLNLSNYCHKQLKPKITWNSLGAEWIINGYSLLNEVDNYLYQISEINSIGWLKLDIEHEELVDTLNKYLKRELNDFSLKRYFEIMMPTIRSRNGKSNLIWLY